MSVTFNLADHPITARELILTLIDSASEPLSAGYFAAAAQLFEMDAGGIRVALGRLVQDGSLRQESRGVYTLASRGGTLHRLVRNWAKVEDSIRSWSGDWLVVLTGHLARADRKQLRGRARAMTLLGFAEANSAMWVRPDNLVTPLAEIRAALIDLGLDAAAVTGKLSDLQPADSLDPDALWDRIGLETRYRDHLSTLNDSTARIGAATPTDAARETLLIGREVTRDILLDPMLPDALLDTDLRGAMIEAMRGYDRRGKTFWRAFLAEHNRSR